MQPRHRFIFLLNSAQRRLQQWIALQQAEAASGGVPAPSPAQAAVLFVLTKNDGCTMGELAQTLDLGPSAMSGLIQRMETMGWVLRQPCPEDGRTQRVWLLPEGQAQMPALKRAMQGINGRLSEGFTEQELDIVARWLEHIQQLDAPVDRTTNDPHEKA